MTADASLVLSRPAGPATELILLFHGVGAQAASLGPLGEFLATQRPQACVVSVAAPFPSDLGAGRQWFSVQGVTEANRPTRIAQALPLFAETVRHWQEETGVAPEATVLVGFSQGAIMALATTQVGPTSASRVVALAGRFAAPPTRAPQGTSVHLIHGAEDPVIVVGHSLEAGQALRALGARVTVDLVPGLGHAIDARMANLIVARLGPPPGDLTSRAARAG